MSYADRFKEMLMATLKGLGIGLIISIVLVFAIGSREISEFLLLVPILTIIFGCIAAIIICSRSGSQGFMSDAVGHIWTGIKGMFFGSLLGGNIWLLAWGLFKMIIGFIIMIPVGIFMALSYFFNLIYLGIMCILEKKNLLEDKAELCEKLDKLSTILALVITVILSIMVFKAMM